MGLFSSCGECGATSFGVRRLRTEVSSLVEDPTGLEGVWAQQLSLAGSRAEVR